MTRTECERKLIEAAQRMMEILHEYAPDAQKLSIDVRFGQINVDSVKCGIDTDTADYSDYENTYNVHATMSPDGEFWDSGRWTKALKGVY